MKKRIVAVGALALGSLVTGGIVLKVAGTPVRPDEETRAELQALFASAMVYQKHCQPSLTKAELATFNDTAKLMGEPCDASDNTVGTQLWVEQTLWSPDPEGWCVRYGNIRQQQLVWLNTLLH